MDTTRILLSTGAHLDVQGSIDEVERSLVAAARGAMMELAHFVDAASGATVRVSVPHVVAVRSAPAP